MPRRMPAPARPNAYHLQQVVSVRAPCCRPHTRRRDDSSRTYHALRHRQHHRAPGIVGAALAHAFHAEIIPDLLHVHAGALCAALRAIPGLFCVTDSTAAAGMPDGEYRLGSHRVIKCMGGVRLPDGTLAGSTLTMDQPMRNLITLGLTLHEASLRVSANAADYLGLRDRGRIDEGLHADLVVLDRDLQLQRVLVEGEDIDLADA
jgi:N-acetylglucosamine-6-phosphate deacetylase